MKTSIAIALILLGTLKAHVVATADHPRSVTMHDRLLAGTLSPPRTNLIDLGGSAVLIEEIAVDKRISAVEGVLLQLNQPGSITVAISLGADDGVKSGDILTIWRKGKRIGGIRVSQVERDRSTAAITAVENEIKLEVGDQITNQQLPDGAQAPVR